MRNLLEVYDLGYNKLAILNDNTSNSAKNIQEDYKINSIDKVSFILPITSNKWEYVLNENLIRWKDEYYFIKLPKFTHSEGSKEVSVECYHMSSSLQGILCPEFELIGMSATELLNSVINSVNCGWTLGNINAPNDKFRALITKEQSVFTNLVKIAELFNAQLSFNSRSKTIDFKVESTNRNIQIRKGKNLQSVDIEYDTSEIVTRLYPFGGVDENGQELNIMSVNPTGKSYIEDYSYYLAQGYTQDYINSHPELFLREMVWNASDYVDAQTLYEDALEKIQTLCKPKVKCSVEGLDLSIFPEYFIDSPVIGETIRIIDEDLSLLIEAKVTDIKKDDSKPLSLKITISNEIEYNSMIKQLVDSSQTVSKIVSTKNEIFGQYIKEATIDTIHVKDAIITNAKLDRASVNKIQIVDADIDRITANKLVVVETDIKNGAITNAKIDRASINKLVVTTADIDNGAITNAKIDRASINKLVVTSADIDNGAITNAKIDRATVNKIQIETGDIALGAIKTALIDTGAVKTAQIDNLAVTDAKIVGMTANKITAGTIDASKITVTNLRAESIVAGALTIDGDNLIHGTDFSDLSKWTVDASGWVLDTSVRYDTSNTVKISRTGLGVNTLKNIISEKISISEGQKLVASVYTMSDNISGIDGSDPYLDIAYYNSSDILLSHNYTLIKPSSNNTWSRFNITLPSPTNTAYAVIRLMMWKNGNLWIARPMLQRGSVASEWKLHTDEQISDGAINNDKLGDNAVTGRVIQAETITGDKLVMNTITAREIASRTITANEIVANTITGDEINSNTIDARHLRAGSVTATKINAKGLSIVTDVTIDGVTQTVPTLNIFEDGSVRMSGQLESYKYLKGISGWRIDPLGNAEFNDSIVRGKVALPNAGMTNFADPNQTIGRNLLLNSSLMTNSGQFKANQNVTLSNPNNEYLRVYSNQSNSTPGIVINPYSLQDGVYTVSFDVRGLNGTNNIGVDLLGDAKYATITSSFTRCSIVLTPTMLRNYFLIYISATAIGQGFEIKNIKLEKGNKATEYSPAPEDYPNPVRIWAGSDEGSKEFAPFRVHQDGSFVATKGTIGGTFTGRVEIGNIIIEDTKSTDASFVMSDNFDVPVIKLHEKSSFINNPFTIGNDATKYFYVDTINKVAEFNDTPLTLKQTGIASNLVKDMVLPNNKDRAFIEFKGNSHNFDIVNGMFKFNSNSSGATHDFSFEKPNGSVDVFIKGSLEIDDFAEFGTLIMQKKTESGNEGIDFIFV